MVLMNEQESAGVQTRHKLHGWSLSNSVVRFAIRMRTKPKSMHHAPLCAHRHTLRINRGESAPSWIKSHHLIASPLSKATMQSLYEMLGCSGMAWETNREAASLKVPRAQRHACSGHPQCKVRSRPPTRQFIYCVQFIVLYSIIQLVMYSRQPI